jgi:phosphatidylserine/phosphatidylglycerophosphate/cardiolipin synthase-like enzyme
MTALHDARARGIDISVMYSQSNRMPILTPIRSYYVKKLNAMGVNIYPWIQQYNHSKLYWNESTAIIGSPNLDIFSLYVWYESMLWGKNAALVDLLDARWAQLLDGTAHN